MIMITICWTHASQFPLEWKSLSARFIHLLIPNLNREDKHDRVEMLGERLLCSLAETQTLKVNWSHDLRKPTKKIKLKSELKFMQVIVVNAKRKWDDFHSFY